jgi:hypothetical protein
VGHLVGHLVGRAYHLARFDQLVVLLVTVRVAGVSGLLGPQVTSLACAAPGLGPYWLLVGGLAFDECLREF